MLKEVVNYKNSQTELIFIDNSEEIINLLHNSVLIIDSKIFKLYPELFKNKRTIILNSNEVNKSFSSVEFIIDELIKQNISKKDTIIGIGGGVICDITGFAGSIYKRGINYGFIPTTLLAMIDASIGGKNGINFNNFKNVIGTINQPRFIIQNSTFLNTLPKIEIKSGLGEIIKSYILAGISLNELKDNNINFNTIKKAIDFKISIVIKDEFESGLRKILNFGHTVGHAVESLYNIKHGIAVLYGIKKAIEISEIKSNLSKQIKEEFLNIIDFFEIDFSFEIIKNDVLNYILMDKKRINEKIDFILLEDYGKPIIYPLSIDEILEYL